MFKRKTSHLQAYIIHFSLSVCSLFEMYLTSQLRVRVANELGAGNAKGAKFALLVSLFSSLVVGILFCTIVIAFNEKLAMIFSSSVSIIKMVNELAVLLAFTILFNSIQPVLSGNSVGYVETPDLVTTKYLHGQVIFRCSCWIWLASISSCG